MRGKIDQIESAIYKERNLAKFKTGDTVEVHYRIKELNTERIQLFEGVVIAIDGIRGSKTFTVRKVMQGIGVERIFPFGSPNIAKIKVKRIGKTRRSKLYYLRKKKGRKARIREVFISQKNIEKENELQPGQKAKKKEVSAETTS